VAADPGAAASRSRAQRAANDVLLPSGGIFLDAILQAVWRALSRPGRVHATATQGKSRGVPDTPPDCSDLWLEIAGSNQVAIEVVWHHPATGSF